MDRADLQFRPTLGPDEIGERLGRLLVPGPIDDRDLENRIARIEERFRVYAACSPHGLWAPGLAITREMTGIAEMYLPLDEIRRAFNRLFTRSLRFSPFLPASVVHTSASWLDVLHRLQPLVRQANPASLLRRLMADEAFRVPFLFSLFLPRRYGATFGRYPDQSTFLRDWLAAHRPRTPVRCLDAACGSGEGSYELVLLLLGSGYPPGKITVHGATVEPLELFAAAHGRFPHDPERQAAFRGRFRGLMAGDGAETIVFYREDLAKGDRNAPEEYDIILCNGLLGGPLLNDPKELTETVRRLGARLREGGILVAADRFHGGWKRSTPEDALRDMLARDGLKVLAGAGGIAAMKPRTG